MPQGVGEGEGVVDAAVMEVHFNKRRVIIVMTMNHTHQIINLEIKINFSGIAKKI